MHFKKTGLLSTQIHRLIFIGMILWVGIYFIISIYLYNQTIPFSFKSQWISSLGNPALGVKSPTIFNIGIFSTGILFLYHFLWLYSTLSIKPKGVKIFIFGMIILGVIGFGAIAIFTDNIQPIHDIMASFAFAGLGLGYLSFDLVFLQKGKYFLSKNIPAKKQSKSKSKLIAVKRMILMILFSAVFLIIAVGIFISGGINYQENGDWIIIWEWLAFFALGINIIVVMGWTDYFISFTKNKASISTKTFNEE